MDAFLIARGSPLVVAGWQKPVNAHSKVYLALLIVTSGVRVPNNAAADKQTDTDVTDRYQISVKYLSWLRLNSVCRALRANLLSYSVCAEVISPLCKAICQTRQAKLSNPPNGRNDNRLYGPAAAIYHALIVKLRGCKSMPDTAQQRQPWVLFTLNTALTDAHNAISECNPVCDGEGA
ncbi:hypothetical protein Q4488_04835 [Amphritea sp. 1_MG-2023]|uniref:hypothetical protein n=1 Tax=Amphritea sp. 1_MG-2023 TaxID=3062670 RepID=UPI0026E3EFAF|nr:hypothetical protein [Amphritea sp. 1_MG-2023]MDO6562703.1 hypothetical protein [Amphritea sp. 1_MG-2023]